MIPILLLTLASAAQAQAPIRGFTPGQVPAQHELEKKVRALPEASRAKTYLQAMAAEPHHAGSPQSKAVAEYALKLFREWGYEAQLEEFDALLPFPLSRSLEMTSPTRYRARLHEPVRRDDPDSADAHQLPTYNAYSASGDVTAPVVYVNYGLPSDYEVLKKKGIDVKGKIVLARYGQSWRGTKVKAAHENGAAACLIYSDPRDDGYFQGDVFPRGPYRPQHSVQRGSVMDMPLYVGDPLSPGWASEKGARRLNREEAGTIMKIPSLPISWADARPLLENLKGEVAPPEWRGALPLTYHIGPGPASARLKVDFDWTSKPLFNVVARMRGAELPDEWIVYGNHHDAWVNGANDPISGAVALMESARAIAALRETGWKPKRSLVFALWDAEEFGLVGSTEWVEKHRDDLQRKAVAYLNSDTNAGKRFSAGGSHILEEFLRQVLRDVAAPEGERSLLDHTESDGGRRFELSPPGAGSDYVAFVHHAGIPVLNMGFGSPGGFGTYHSIYDSTAWFLKHIDPEVESAKRLAHVTATAILRLSETSVLPYEFGSLHRVVGTYITEIESQRKIDLSRARQEWTRMKTAAAAYEAALARANGAPAARLARVNRHLLDAERALTRAAGLPGREWYKHHIYAPGIYTGYSARTLPGVREPADLGRTAEANEQAGVLADVLRQCNTHIERATALVGGE